MNRGTRQHRGHRRLHGVHRGLTVQHGKDLERMPLFPTARCTTGKRRYVNELEAELVLAGIHRPDSSRREQRAYACSACSGWHLTSWSLEDFTTRCVREVSTPARALAAPTTRAGERATAPAWHGVHNTDHETPAQGAGVSPVPDQFPSCPRTAPIPTPLEVAARTAGGKRTEAEPQRAQSIRQRTVQANSVVPQQKSALASLSDRIRGMLRRLRQR